MMIDNRLIVWVDLYRINEITKTYTKQFKQ